LALSSRVFGLGLAGAPYLGFNWRFCERHLKRQLDFVIVSFDGVHRCAQCVADYIVLETGAVTVRLDPELKGRLAQAAANISLLRKWFACFSQKRCQKGNGI
jgi:hypothetical protein